MTSSSTVVDLAGLLGDDDYSFRFIGEGAANVVLEIVQSPDSISSPTLRGKLLRVPKERAVALDYRDVQHYWETSVKPLFQDGDLVDQQLITLGSANRHEDLVSRMNATLDDIQSVRRKDFQGTSVSPQAEYGMLVDDMRSQNPQDVVLEFKPKWLAQSPDAPANAIRCRNCAKEALRQDDKQQKASAKSSHHHHQEPQKPAICTFDLFQSATSPLSRQRLISLISPSSSSSSASLNLQLSTWFESQTPNTTTAILPCLALAQTSCASSSYNLSCLLTDLPPPSLAQLELAMTLRDCTCFVRIPGDPAKPVQAKLADLDKKNGAAKLPVWRALEERLIDEGYYTRERPREEWTCLLERKEGS